MLVCSSKELGGLFRKLNLGDFTACRTKLSIFVTNILSCRYSLYLNFPCILSHACQASLPAELDLSPCSMYMYYVCMHGINVRIFVLQKKKKCFIERMHPMHEINLIELEDLHDHKPYIPEIGHTCI